MKFDIFRENLEEAFLELNQHEEKSDANFNKINILYLVVYEKIVDYENALYMLDKVDLDNIENIFRKNDLKLKLGKDRENKVEFLYNSDFIEKNILTIILSSIENKFILIGYNLNTSIFYLKS